VTYRCLSTAVLACSLLSGCSMFDNKAKSKAADSERARPATADGAAEPATPRISAMTHLAAGQMLEKQGDLKGAIEQYERAISVNPRFTTAYNRLAIVYQKLGKFADAEQMFQQGIRADPGAAMLRNNLGYIYLATNRLPEAETQCREALRISPDFKRARMNLAVTLARAGRPQESLIEFSHVVPADVAHYNLGIISLDLKNFALAESSFRQALAINPGCPGAKEYLERVSRLAKGNSDPQAGPELPTDASLAGQIGADGGNTPP
jgi:tetratricopeptide (TPR) repeat protein